MSGATDFENVEDELGCDLEGLPPVRDYLLGEIRRVDHLRDDQAALVTALHEKFCLEAGKLDHLGKLETSVHSGLVAATDPSWPSYLAWIGAGVVVLVLAGLCIYSNRKLCQKPVIHLKPVQPQKPVAHLKSVQPQKLCTHLKSVQPQNVTPPPEVCDVPDLCSVTEVSLSLAVEKAEVPNDSPQVSGVVLESPSKQCDTPNPIPEPILSREGPAQECDLLTSERVASPNVENILMDDEVGMKANDGAPQNIFIIFERSEEKSDWVKSFLDCGKMAMNEISKLGKSFYEKSSPVLARLQAKIGKQMCNELSKLRDLAQERM